MAAKQKGREKMLLFPAQFIYVKRSEAD